MDKHRASQEKLMEGGCEKVGSVVWRPGAWIDVDCITINGGGGSVW